MNEIEEQVKNELADKAKDLMSEWSSARNKQKQFILNYLANGFDNATQSAIKAGYSEKTARSMASNMLAGVNKYKHIPGVVNELRNAFDDEKERLSIADATEVMQYWTKVLRGEITEYKLPPGGKHAIEVPPSVTDRNNAGKLLLKTSGEMKEQVEVSGGMDVGKAFEDLTTEELRKLANGDVE